MKRGTLYVGCALTLLLAACAGSGAGPTTVPSEQPATEISSQADLVAALQSQGATVEPADAIEQAFFQVSGQILRVNGADVQLFEYGDEAARTADSELISPDGTSISTTMVTWVDTPHFWADGRLIVLYVGNDAQVIELLRGALGDPLTPS